MQWASSTRWLLACVALTAIALPAHAQEEPRPYVKFDIDPGFEQMLKDRLQMEKELGPLKDLVKQIAGDPSKFPLDPAKLKDLNLDDPKFKQALQDWAARDPRLREALREWLKQNPRAGQPENLKQFHDDLRAILESAPKHDDPPSPFDLPTALPGPGGPAKPRTESLAKVAERAMQRVENGKLGDWLRDSPAWNRAFADLRNSIKHSDAPRWEDRFEVPEGQAAQLGEEALKLLREIPPPNLENFNWREAFPAIGRMPMPNFNPPGLSDVGGPSLPSAGTGTTWLVLALLGLIIGWWLLRRSKRPAPARDERTTLGPWPVRPEAVATRAELVLAFDYLALLTLGNAARSWNHQAIALSWRAQAPACADTVQALAHLYEHARYTDGAEQLSEAQRDQARRSLLQLAEAL